MRKPCATIIYDQLTGQYNDDGVHGLVSLDVVAFCDDVRDHWRPHRAVAIRDGRSIDVLTNLTPRQLFSLPEIECAAEWNKVAA